MPDEKLVFRSVYVDRDVDVSLQADAKRAGVSKGGMFRKYLQAGIAACLTACPVRRSTPADARMAARSVYLPSALDAEVRSMALELHTSETQLIRQLVRIGMSSLKG